VVTLLSGERFTEADLRGSIRAQRWETGGEAGHNGLPAKKGPTMAETVKKGARITGADRAKLAGEPTKKYADGVSVRDLSATDDDGNAPDESGPVPQSAAPEETSPEDQAPS
jgi:hypothetical protein